MKIKSNYLLFLFILLACGYFFNLSAEGIDSNDIKKESVKENNNDKYAKERANMVEVQIRKRGIKDKATLDAMNKVKRHLFVPKYLIGSAYDDCPLPIGHGQTISQPYIVAYMTEKLQLEPGDHALEIGTGSGYQAAVLSKIVKDVYTVEIIPELGNSAAAKFKRLDGYNNVSVKVADGYYGWVEHAPYDAIIVTAAAGYIPEPLVKQLKDGGRMIIPVGGQFWTQYLMLLEKNGDEIKTTRLIPVRFVPFTRKR